MASTSAPTETPNLYTLGLRWDTWPEWTCRIHCASGPSSKLSEMAGINFSEVENVQAFVTTRDDGAFRLPFARTSLRPMPLRFMIVATTNNKHDQPIDASGNRHYGADSAVRKARTSKNGFGIVRNQLWAVSSAAPLSVVSNAFSVPCELGNAAGATRRRTSRPQLS